MSGSTDQRYYASTYGRFNTADPYGASGGPSDPGSWNRYSYVEGDPINHLDRQGLCTEDIDGDFWDGAYETIPLEAVYYMPGSCFGDPTFQAVYSTVGAVLNGVFLMAPPPPPPTTPPPPPPTCDQILTLNVQDFLFASDPLLLNWDATLAVDFVAVAESDGVDPRLMASIATLESGHGTAFGGQNNPFGLGPGLNFPTPLAAVQSQGITLKHLMGYGDTTVALLYSGKSGVIDKRAKKYVQPPGYCQGAGCPAAGMTVAAILAAFAGNPAVGLTNGNPGVLGYPCP